MDWRGVRSQGWVDPPNCGPYDHQCAKPATTAIMIDNRKEIVKEWAAEFELDGLLCKD